MLAIQTILHPTDFSENSRRAFRTACMAARITRARLVILHVVEPPMAVAVEGVMLLPTEIDVNPLKEKLRELRPRRAKFPIEHRTANGDPAQEIVRMAEETAADLIVMGTHGRSGFGRLLMGSVAEHVVRRAPCPVMTVKAPPTAKRRATRTKATLHEPVSTAVH